MNDVFKAHVFSKAIMFKDDENSHVSEESDHSAEHHDSGRRRSLLALVAFVATAGCDGSASVRDTGYTNYAYYGRNNYYRSPGRRGYGRRW